MIIELLQDSFSSNWSIIMKGFSISSMAFIFLIMIQNKMQREKHFGYFMGFICAVILILVGLARIIFEYLTKDYSNMGIWILFVLFGVPLAYFILLENAELS